MQTDVFATNLINCFGTSEAQGLHDRLQDSTAIQGYSLTWSLRLNRQFLRCASDIRHRKAFGFLQAEHCGVGHHTWTGRKPQLQPSRSSWGQITVSLDWHIGSYLWNKLQLVSPDPKCSQICQVDQYSLKISHICKSSVFHLQSE